MRNKQTAAAFAALSVAVSLGAIAPAQSAGSVDARWSGYAVVDAPNAAGGWLGGRSIDTTRVYRIDPGATTGIATAFGPATKVATLTGRGPKKVTTRDTARAAWIVSKYGTYKYNVQNAAVEVALDELLYGGEYAYAAATQGKRIKATGDGAAIRDFATTMLNDSNAKSGPYSVTVTPASGAVVGKPSNVVVTVKSYAGNGIPNLPVTLTYGGTAQGEVKTDATGVARISVTPASGGPVAASAFVDLLPATTLSVMAPTPTTASRVVVAGLKGSTKKAATQTVQAVPALTLVSTRTPMLASSAMRGTLTLAKSYAAGRTVKLAVHGPYDTMTGTCDPAKVVDRASVYVKANGSYAWPTGLHVPRWGYYLVSATMPATKYNVAATACGGATVAQKKPTVSAARLATPVTLGTAIEGQWKISGLPTNAKVTGAMTLYGPFRSADRVACTATKTAGTVAVSTTTDGTVVSPTVKPTASGWYGWRASVTAGPWTSARTGACGSSASLVKVTP